MQLVVGVEGAVEVVEHAAPPGDAVTVYPMIVAPPLSRGALQETTADVLPRSAVTPVGIPGTVRGVTALDATDALLVPAAFAAVTVNV